MQVATPEDRNRCVVNRGARAKEHGAQAEPTSFGEQAESKAEAFLRNKGFRILARNVRWPSGELDLVADSNGVLVFVEVKARTWSDFGGAVAAVDRRKQERVIRLAARYLMQHRIKDRACRFDVVLFEPGAEWQNAIEHIENAFEVPGDDLRW